MNLKRLSFKLKTVGEDVGCSSMSRCLPSMSGTWALNPSTKIINTFSN